MLNDDGDESPSKNSRLQHTNSIKSENLIPSGVAAAILIQSAATSHASPRSAVSPSQAPVLFSSSSSSSSSLYRRPRNPDRTPRTRTHARHTHSRTCAPHRTHLTHRPPKMKEHRHAPSPLMRIRRSRFFQPLLIAIGLTTFLLFIYRSTSSSSSSSSSSGTTSASEGGSKLTDYSHGGDVAYPPKWDKMAQWQKDLPQHDLNLPYPEGRTGRYLKFSSQIRYLGWNNCLNEMYVVPSLHYL